MFSHSKWLFFDIGSTLVDEQLAYRHRFRDIAEAAGVSEEFVFDTALLFYRQNQKGDKETAQLLCVTMPKWHTEDEILYHDAAACLAILRQKYNIGIIANQDYGMEERPPHQCTVFYRTLMWWSRPRRKAWPSPTGESFRLHWNEAAVPPNRR